MMHERSPRQLRRRETAQDWQETHAILRRISRHRSVEQIRAGRKKVELPDERRAAGSRRGYPRSTRDERHVMSALKKVGFESPHTRTRIVADAPEFLETSGRRKAIVGGKDDERIFRESIFFQGG